MVAQRILVFQGNAALEAFNRVSPPNSFEALRVTRTGVTVPGSAANGVTAPVTDPLPYARVNGRVPRARNTTSSARHPASRRRTPVPNALLGCRTRTSQNRTGLILLATGPLRSSPSVLWSR